MPTIALATTDDAIARCHAVMAELRPHVTAAEFVPRVQRMRGTGYHLAYLEDDTGEVRAVAGYRLLDQLVRGLVLYVDDLVTAPAARSHGHGGALLEWLYQEARARGCTALELDSGVQRHGAHRFYFRERMHVTGYHFLRPC